MPIPISSMKKEGERSAKYAFIAVNEANKCGMGVNCARWRITGTYKVVTPSSGKSVIEMNVRVEPPVDGEKLDMNQRFGITWSVGYTDKKTESFVAYWRPKKQEFAMKNWHRETPIEKA